MQAYKVSKASAVRLIIPLEISFNNGFIIGCPVNGVLLFIVLSLLQNQTTIKREISKKNPAFRKVCLDTNDFLIDIKRVLRLTLAGT